MPNKRTSVDFSQAFSTVEGLGAPVAYFSSIPKSRTVGITAAVILFLTSLVIFCSGAITAYQVYTQYGIAVVSNTLRAPVLIALLVLFICVLVIIFTLVERHDIVAVFEGGLAYKSEKLIQSLRWDEIAQVFVSISKGIWGGPNNLYTIKGENGLRLSIDDHFENVEEFGRLISENITPLKYQSAAANYNDGQDVLFGKVVVNQSALKINSRIFAWGEIERIRLQKGSLRVFKKDGNFLSTASIPAASIPNLDTLLLVIEQIAGIEIGA
jgi:hypothetical protein